MTWVVAFSVRFCTVAVATVGVFVGLAAGNDKPATAMIPPAATTMTANTASALPG